MSRNDALSEHPEPAGSAKGKLRRFDVSAATAVGSSTVERETGEHGRDIGFAGEEVDGSPATWGRVPAFSVIAAASLVGMACAHALSRSGRDGGDVLFWVAFVVPVVWAAGRLLSPVPARRERIGIVVVLGLTLYLAKLLQNPFTFMYSDEFVHAYNAQRVLDTGGLFSDNPLLPVTPFYPGLASATSAVASVTGMGVFASGVFVLGAARLLLVLALFLLFEEVSRSDRIAGLATFAYMAHPNFLFFASQYAYESLALPLAALVLAGLLRWMRPEDDTVRRAWAGVAVLVTVVVVMTHHMTSYALLAFLVALALTQKVVRTPLRAPWAFASVAAAATIGWLFLVASETVGYLTPVFVRALDSTVQTVRNERAGRELFASDTGLQTPLLERAVGVSAVGLLALALPFGLLEVWRRFRRHPAALVLAIAAGAYLGTLLLRFAPGAWEIGNRASEFLFIGVAFMLALAARLATDATRSRGTAALSTCAAVIFAGGVVAGWSHDLRLSLPYRIAVSGETLEPQGTTAGRWSRAHVRRGRFAADESNARLLLSQDVYADAGRVPDIADLLVSPVVEPWMVRLLTDHGFDHVVMGRLVVSNDNQAGYFFTSERAKRAGEQPRAVYEKLDRQRGVSRVFDSGDLAIYDVGQIRYDPTLR